MAIKDRAGNKERLAEIGKAMYGERWQRPLAKALGIRPVQVYRWVKLHYEPDAKTLYQAEEILRQFMTNAGKVMRARKES